MLYFDVSGTSVSIGEAIGEQFKQRIRAYVEYRFQQITNEFSQLGVNFNRSSYYDISNQLIQYSEQQAPEEMQELKGVARAANLLIDDVLFAVGYTDIFDLILSREKKLSQALYEMNAECTTFIYNKGGKLLCGQNWDMDEGSANNCCYFRKHYLNGSFIQGLSTVIGTIHIGVNDKGMFIGTANLCSVRNSPNGVIFPITIQHLLRNGLDEKSLNWLNNTTKVGGHYFYIINNNIHPMAVECDAQKCVIRNITDSYVHTNHYREVDYKDSKILYSADSIMRCEYMEKELSRQNVSIDSIKSILSNHENKICRHWHENSYSRTCASIIFDSINREIHLCESNPCMKQWCVKEVSMKKVDI